MADKQPFEPYKAPKMVTITVTVREQKVLDIIRKSPFGRFTVHKANNVIVRIEKDESIMIDESE